MRPEISQLMRHIYPELKDDECVSKYENIKGIEKNIFFIDHNQVEGTEAELKSHYNVYEAEYLSQLCRYLLLQGYCSRQITILTPYSGQLYKLKDFMSKALFGGVRVTLVDNFQGEENDIILLSLVRSNKENKIGFLGIENRVCVALSRAKMGLYVIGNFTQLHKMNTLWTKLVHDMRKNACLGPSLTLYCQNHPDNQRIEASKPADFDQAPEGGCRLPCDYRLSCGHQCGKACHITDMEHLDYLCHKPCNKKLCERGHLCGMPCYRPCDPCLKRVKKQLPSCGHEITVECSKDISEANCTEQCPKILRCGHRCNNRCGQLCETVCSEKVKKLLPCMHEAPIQCGTHPENAKCPVKCQELLKCGHPCGGSCSECLKGRVHVLCRKKCDRTLTCGHPCSSYCSNECPPCTRPCENRCSHSKCREKCGMPCASCMERCENYCKHYRCTLTCGEPCNRPLCMEPCRKILKCGHRCIGLCEEKCPPLCRICNRNEVTDILFGNEDKEDACFIKLEDCGHMIEVTALDKWMSQTDEAQTDEEQANVGQTIAMKVCPRCKVPIRCSRRYGNVTNRNLKDIEMVKEKIRGNSAELKANQKTLRQHADRFSFSDPNNFLHKDKLTLHELNVLENQIVFEESIMELILEIRDSIRNHQNQQQVDVRHVIKKDLDMIQRTVNGLKSQISEQQREEIAMELLRLRQHFKLGRILQWNDPSMKRCGTQLYRDVMKVQQWLHDGLKHTEEKVETMNNLIKEVNKCLGYQPVTDEERKMVVKAMNFAKGHWYKCPNGHPYAIADCGGATVESKCPECGVTVGGRNHALAEGNTVATEMDGAQYGAWSEQANLLNYDPQEF